MKKRPKKTTEELIENLAIITKGGFDDVRKEMKEGFTDVRSEMKAEFVKVDTRLNAIEGKIDNMYRIRIERLEDDMRVVKTFMERSRKS